MSHLFIDFETLGKLLDLFVPQVHHLYRRTNNSTFLTESLEVLKELMHIKHLEQCLTLVNNK